MLESEKYKIRSVNPHVRCESAYYEVISKPGVVAHTHNPSTWKMKHHEIEEGKILSEDGRRGCTTLWWGTESSMYKPCE